MTSKSIGITTTGQRTASKMPAVGKKNTTETMTKMEEKIIHVVTAHRTTKSQHSYVVGVYENVYDAEQAASIESINRGRKYDMHVDIHYLNKMPEDITNIERD